MSLVRISGVCKASITESFKEAGEYWWRKKHNSLFSVSKTIDNAVDCSIHC